MKNWRSGLIGFGLLLLIAVIAGLTYPSCVSEQQKQRAAELKRVAGEITPYPRAKANGDQVVFKTDVVYFFTYYLSQDDFDQVKEFYDQQLKAKGWTMVETPPSIIVGPPDSRKYRKGDYMVVVERDDNGRKEYFDVTFEWNPGNTN